LSDLCLEVAAGHVSQIAYGLVVVTHCELVASIQQPGAMPGALPHATMHLPAESSTAALPSSLSFSVTADVGGPGTAIMDSSRLSPFVTAEHLQW
jgi:hypothetical protein